MSAITGLRKAAEQLKNCLGRKSGYLIIDSIFELDERLAAMENKQEDKMENYDPSIKWVLQTVEIDLQMWDHKITMTAEVGGNCFGFDVMEGAISQIYEKLLPDIDGAPAEIRMLNARGDELLTVDEDEKGEDWLKDMVVGIRITNQPKPATPGAVDGAS